jgi:hypothetical protein
MYQYVAPALSFVIISCVQTVIGPSSCVVGLDLDVVSGRARKNKHSQELKGCETTVPLYLHHHKKIQHQPGTQLGTHPIRPRAGTLPGSEQGQRLHTRPLTYNENHTTST